MTEAQMKTRRGVYAVCALVLAIVAIMLVTFVHETDISVIPLFASMTFYARAMYWKGRIKGHTFTAEDREAIADAGYAEGWRDAVEEVKRRRGLAP